MHGGGVGQIDLGECDVERNKDVRKEREVDKDILSVEEGETVCKNCELDCKTSSGLQKHIDNKHKDIAPFVCKVCNKGFITRNGYKKHKVQHKSIQELKKVAEEKPPDRGEKTSGIYVCKAAMHSQPVYCLSRNSYKGHLKQFHGERKSVQMSRVQQRVLK